MRFRSTPDSVASGEMTILAVIECVFSVAIYGGIALYTHSLIHIAVAVACAPLFLLRTKYSVAVGMRMWERVQDRLDSVEMDALAYVLIPLASAFGLVIRAMATLLGVIRYPRETLNSIPRNWRRQALCTDFFYAPEIVPGELRQEDGISFNNVIGAFGKVKKNTKNDPKELIAMTILLSAILVIGYIPAIAFRISFKAAAVIYLPIIFVARSTRSTGSTIRWKLERFSKSELEKTRRVASKVIIFCALAKFALSQGIVEREFLVSYLKSERLTDAIIRDWPLFGFSLLIDSVITLSLFYYADASLSRIEASHGFKSRRVSSVISTLTFTRSLVATVTALYVFTGALSVVLQRIFGAYWSNPIAFFA